jgi:hypothetical protein
VLGGHVGQSTAPPCMGRTPVGVVSDDLVTSGGQDSDSLGV